MGMFDSIKVKAALPSEGEVAGLGVNWNEQVYQTKDLENILGYYEVGEDGRLRMLKTRIGWAEGDSVDGEGADKLPPQDSSDWELIPHHGKVRFYTSYCDCPDVRWDYSLNSSQMSWSDIMATEGNDWWIEFEGTFDEGVLRTVKMLDPEKTPIRVRLASSKEWAQDREAEARKLTARAAAFLRGIPGFRRAARKASAIENQIHCAINRTLSRLS